MVSFISKFLRCDCLFSVDSVTDNTNSSIRVESGVVLYNALVINPIQGEHERLVTCQNTKRNHDILASNIVSLPNHREIARTQIVLLSHLMDVPITRIYALFYDASMLRMFSGMPP